MGQSHYALRRLARVKSPDKDVFVQLATLPARKCVIFIHGYGGDPLETWSDFPAMIHRYPSIPSAVDYYYYGYDAIQDDLTASAAILREFLGRLLNDPSATLHTLLSTRADGSPHVRYSDVTLVAHSLGAVIARRAVTDATMERESWPKHIKMVFFAPAHTGAVIVELVKSMRGTGLFGALFSVLQAGAQFRSPLIKQLEADSAELKALAADVTALRQGGRNAHLSAQVVTLASREKIVSNVPFPLDPRPNAIPNSTHQSVCKPKENFLDPLEILARWI